MISLLNKIKPKRLSETLKGYVFKDKIVLDFGSSTVICFGDTGISSSSPLCLTHKDLYNQEFDNAIAVDHLDFIIPEYTLPGVVMNWFDITFNATDNSFFSAISGTGEDLFWSSSMTRCDNGFNFDVYGLNHMCKYEYGDQTNVKAKYNLDYNTFYYLFQLTKHLNGKKTDIIQYAYSMGSGELFFTNSNRDYYVICNQRNKTMKWKKDKEPLIEKIYLSKETKMQQVFKKTLNEGASPLFKAMSRPFGDVLEYREDKYYGVYSDARYKLWVMKKKEK